jgi:hypothetical protein
MGSSHRFSTRMRRTPLWGRRGALTQRVGKICTGLPGWFGIDMWSRGSSSMMVRMLPCMCQISKKININGVRPRKNLVSGLTVKGMRSIVDDWASG